MYTKPLAKGDPSTTSGHCYYSLNNPHPLQLNPAAPNFLQAWILGTTLYHYRRRICFFVSRESENGQELACSCILGSNGLFTDMICFRLLRWAQWKKSLQGLQIPKGSCCFRDIPAQSGQAAPIPPAKGSFPCSPRSRRGEP